MKKLELERANDALANYVQEIGQETLVLMRNGQPVAILMPLTDTDLETIALSTNPEFLAILEASRESLKTKGGTPIEVVKQRLGLP
jgi:PHD/YefM family antitoxin component YafN of YafNO toxin-antitoxin module